MNKNVFEQAIKLLHKNKVLPGVIESLKQAKRFTKDDPFGHKWKVGDQYYVMYFRGTTPKGETQ